MALNIGFIKVFFLSISRILLAINPRDNKCIHSMMCTLEQTVEFTSRGAAVFAFRVRAVVLAPHHPRFMSVHPPNAFGSRYVCVWWCLMCPTIIIIILSLKMLIGHCAFYALCLDEPKMMHWMCSLLYILNDWTIVTGKRCFSHKYTSRGHFSS